MIFPSPVFDDIQTYLWFGRDLLGEMFSGQGGFGIRINANARDLSFALIAVKEPADVPEPATLAVIGLGLAGLGLAKRRK